MYHRMQGKYGTARRGAEEERSQSNAVKHASAFYPDNRFLAAALGRIDQRLHRSPGGAPSFSAHDENPRRPNVRKLRHRCTHMLEQRANRLVEIGTALSHNG